MSTTQEKIAVMQAHVDGKEIEFMCIFLWPHNTNWERAGGPCWGWSEYNYRVKPAPIPWTFETAPRGGWLRRTNFEQVVKAITAIMPKGVGCSNEVIKYETALSDFQYSPDGISWGPCSIS